MVGGGCHTALKSSERPTTDEDAQTRFGSGSASGESV